MDEKLRNAIITFLQDAYNEGNANRGCVTDTSGEVEQAFRDDGWIKVGNHPLTTGRRVE
jgi:hypothetical protein